MYNLEFSSEELILLESIIKKSIIPNNNADKVILNFSQDEMENLEETLLSELHKNIDIWFELFQQQQKNRTVIEKLFRKASKPTAKMSQQWKYMGKIEEIYNRIAAPIGRGKRIDLKEFEEYL